MARLPARNQMKGAALLICLLGVSAFHQDSRLPGRVFVCLSLRRAGCARPLRPTDAHEADGPRPLVGSPALCAGPVVLALAALASARRGPRAARRGRTARRGTAVVDPRDGAAHGPEGVAAPQGSDAQRKKDLDLRINPDDRDRAVSFQQLVRWGRTEGLTLEEIRHHWTHTCVPVGNVSHPTDQVTAEAPQVKVWRRIWSVNSLGHMWTEADWAHIHGLSGMVYAVGGFLYLLDTALHDATNGFWEQHVSTSLGVILLAVGAVNALSGLQPALVAFRGFPQALGFGEKPNLRSGGFANASFFFLVLAYQALRALPGFPAQLAVLDAPIALSSLLAMGHTAMIFNGWVCAGAIHRIDALVLPSILNLPVAVHMIAGGQPWIDQMSAFCPQWPAFFFSGNFAIAWALSMVTFLLSLYERRAISLELRGMLMLVLPVVVFASLPLRAGQLLPELHDQWLALLTLNPPTA